MTYLDDSEVKNITEVLGILTRTISSSIANSASVSTHINPRTAQVLLSGVRSVAEQLLAKDNVNGGPEGLSDLIDQVDQGLTDAGRHIPGTGYSDADSSPISLNNAVHYANQAEQARNQRVADLKLWWLTKAESEVEMVAAKAVVYGSNSLEQLGRKTAQLAGRQVDSEEAQELGCWINLVQKTERWTDAVMRGERPKDDTITDIATYATMALRIRNAGGWPDSEGA